MRRLPVFLAALWWGGIAGMSFVAVPTIFAVLGNPAVAGPVAARIFSLQCWGSMLLGVLLMLVLRRQRAALSDITASAASVAALRGLLVTMTLVVLAVVFAMLQEFGVAPKIVSARATGGNLRVWHTLGTVLVLGQWLCAGAVLWRLSRRGD